LQTFPDYGLRFDLEDNFRDDKSAGFQIEQSEIRNDQALSRLFLILATATLDLVNSGLAVVITRISPEVDTHWQRGLSYLQLGWRWVRDALAHGKRLFTRLWFRPGLDPAPVFASNKQAAQPIALLSPILFDL